MINIIVAMAESGAIGNRNRLPWHLPNDLQYFKQKTLNKFVVMGRKTYESIGKPLPNRTNVVLTRDKHFSAEGVIVYHTLGKLLEDLDQQDLFIIGGFQIYNMFMDIADKLYVTHIDGVFEADTYMFIDWARWTKRYSIDGKVDEANRHAHTFVLYDRKNKLGEMR